MTVNAKAVLILTGAWHIPKHYHKLIRQLESKGIRVLCPRLPTNNNAVPANQSIGDDVALIQAIVANEAAKGTRLYVLAHSYGGCVASAALGEFALRPGSGKGGIASLTFMTAFVPPEGQSLAAMFGGHLPTYVTHMPETRTMVWTDPIQHLYNDVPEEEALWAERLRVAHPYAAQFSSFDCETAAWRVIPVSYLVCENDQTIPAFVQEAMIENVRKSNVEMTVFRCGAGHSPFLSMPEKVVEVVGTVMSCY